MIAKSNDTVTTTASMGETLCPAVRQVGLSSPQKSKDEVSEAALFDTGATFNYISSALLLSFNEVGHFYQLEKANHHSVSLADGSKVESDGSVKILVRYGGSQRMLLFHVVPSLSPRVVIGWEGIAALGLLIDAYRSDIVCSVEESDDSLQSPLLARMGLTDDDIIPKDQLVEPSTLRTMVGFI